MRRRLLFLLLALVPSAFSVAMLGIIWHSVAHGETQGPVTPAQPATHRSDAPRESATAPSSKAVAPESAQEAVPADSREVVGPALLARSAASGAAAPLYGEAPAISILASCSTAGGACAA